MCVQRLMCKKKNSFAMAHLIFTQKPQNTSELFLHNW